jgi:hypothetical protein
MSRFTVVYDACVLYPAPLRSLLMYLAVTDLYHARWSDEIHEEWMRNVVKDHADISRTQVERIRDLMNLHVRDGLVTGYEPLIDTLTLPDPNDRHVLAAAIHCEADTILTFNLKDFPPEVLKPYDIEAQHPDKFLSCQLDMFPQVVCSAARRQRQSLKRPPMDVERYLASLERQGLAQTVSSLRKFAELI